MILENDRIGLHVECPESGNLVLCGIVPVPVILSSAVNGGVRHVGSDLDLGRIVGIGILFVFKKHDFDMERELDRFRSKGFTGGVGLKKTLQVTILHVYEIANTIV